MYGHLDTEMDNPDRCSLFRDLCRMEDGLLAIQRDEYRHTGCGRTSEGWGVVEMTAGDWSRMWSKCQNLNHMHIDLELVGIETDQPTARVCAAAKANERSSTLIRDISVPALATVAKTFIKSFDPQQPLITTAFHVEVPSSS